MPESDLMVKSVSRVERKRAQNRDALVAAARELFASKGFEATTIAEIAEAADLGFGTFYRYFPDKEAILAAVLDAGQLEIEAVLRHPENDSLPPAEALRGLTARFARAARLNRHLIALVWRVGIRAESAGNKRVRPDQLPPELSLPVMLGAVVRRIIERGIAAGEFATVDARLTSSFIASAHMYLLSPGAMKTGEQALVDALCGLELNALAAGTNGGAARRGA